MQTATGPVNLTADWSLVNYNCTLGQYFDSENTQCATCTANNYCPGGTYNMESQSFGITACPNGYELSDSGAGAQTDCYRACTTNDILHSTAVTGNYYYGNNNQCTPTSCAIGWHSSFDVNNYAKSNTDSASGYINASGDYGTGPAPQVVHPQSYYGLTEPNTWAVELNGSDFRGSARCSGKAGDNHRNPDRPWEGGKWDGDSADWTATTAELESAGSGNYCWCRIDTFRADSSSAWESNNGGLWVYNGEGGEGYYNCTNSCAAWCAWMGTSSSPAMIGNFGTAMLSKVLVPATCEITNLNCSIGQYFDSATATCVTCPANNYCPGGTYNIESQSYGINACPSGYGLSDSGNVSQNKCYRTCSNADVAHSTGVSGGYYYGDNNHCNATGCAAGWHLSQGLDFIEAPSNHTNSSYMSLNGAGSASYEQGNNNYREAYYGLTEPKTWGTHYDDRGGFAVRGSAKCSAKQGDNHTYTEWGCGGNCSFQVGKWDGNKSDWTASTSELTAADAGQYCWCKIDAIKLDSGSWQDLGSTIWVYHNDPSSSVNNCENQCADVCSRMSVQAFREVIFDIASRPTSCEANIIDLDWNPMNGGAHTENQCTYNESITLPATPSKPGYIFNGWTVTPVSGN